MIPASRPLNQGCFLKAREIQLGCGFRNGLNDHVLPRPVFGLRNPMQREAQFPSLDADRAQVFTNFFRRFHFSEDLVDHWCTVGKQLKLLSTPHFAIGFEKFQQRQEGFVWKLRWRSAQGCTIRKSQVGYAKGYYSGSLFAWIRIMASGVEICFHSDCSRRKQEQRVCRSHYRALSH